MDKTTVMDAKTASAEPEIHRLPEGRQPIHDTYGLWICKYSRRSAFPAPRQKERPRYFEHYAISHLLEGRGFYWEPQRGSVPMAEGDAVVVCPHHLHNYGGDGGTYVEDTICFVGPIADRLFQCGLLRNGVLPLGNARRLLPIIEQALIPSVDAQVKANLALQNLIVDLHFDRQRRGQGEAYHYIRRLTEQLVASPETPWTVNRMAEYCNLSPSRFRVVFREATGVAPKTYLDEFRIRNAAEALLQGEDSVSAIAFRFGYRDPYHFSRRFKEVTGYAPRDYRREMRLSRS